MPVLYRLVLVNKELIRKAELSNTYPLSVGSPCQTSFSVTSDWKNKNKDSSCQTDASLQAAGTISVRGRALRNPTGPVSWAARLHWVKPVEPGEDAAQASPCGHKTGKTDWKETHRKDTKSTERITSLRWPGSDVWLPRSSWIKFPEKMTSGLFC